MAYETWSEPDVEDTSIAWAYGDIWHWNPTPADLVLMIAHPGWWAR